MSIPFQATIERLESGCTNRSVEQKDGTWVLCNQHNLCKICKSNIAIAKQLSKEVKDVLDGGKIECTLLHQEWWMNLKELAKSLSRL